MSFDRSRLPDPQSYYESQGLKLSKGKKWVTTSCVFHGGSDSMRINLMSGAFSCMAGCGAKGGDVMSYHRAIKAWDFVTACKDLGCWIEDGKVSSKPPRPTPLSPRDALTLIGYESLLVAGFASSMGHNYRLTQSDQKRLLEACGRIQMIEGFYL
ncbi:MULTISPECIES: hypothetical protein [unclassified Polynucleobacter]|jgi:hypothetical protein|uniref:hypothetical protein n=1 Tax=unclassified Polynucleobacter TaxID=2640945 RepID=UPI0008B6EBDB|nr:MULTISPECIES: hypothetical protein [unclassified Polynucleobacter]OHC10106.1 MAG: hypothetical protein A2X74_10130 [Polynucleobacter sp. GWA2_45_21]HBK43596.1 hypothetical protein [Polynucleobacter sp.]